MTNVVETPIDIQMEYKSFDEYWKPQLAGVGPTGAYMNELSPEHKDKLRLALMKRLRLIKSLPVHLSRHLSARLNGDVRPVGRLGLYYGS